MKDVRRRWITWHHTRAGFFDLECGHILEINFVPDFNSIPKELLCLECSQQDYNDSKDVPNIERAPE